MKNRRSFSIGMIAAALALAAFPSSRGEAQLLHKEMVVVPPNKLPAAAREPGQAMQLFLAKQEDLLLYIEQKQGRQMAIFDVSDPDKVKLKRVASLNASVAFDFVQPVGRSTELIRYRDGSGEALLDLSKPESPQVEPMDATARESYVLPVSLPVSKGSGQPSQPAVVAQDYQIVEPVESRVEATVKGVVQEQVNEEDGTVYLLGADGLTVIRNLKSEEHLIEMAPIWRNSINGD